MIVNKYANGGGGSTSGVTPQDVQQQINSALTPYWESGETKDYVDSAVSGISLDGYYTSAQTEEAIAEAVEGYATSGDMQSAFTLISETQQVAAAGLNQLEGRIDELSGSSVDLSAYYTSAQTEDAISAATAGKADAANVTANPGFKKFPKWNSQGIITGDDGMANVGNITVNDVSNSVFKPFVGNITPFYAPLSAGTAGQILVSAGNGAPVWSAVTMPDMAAYTPTSGFSTINGSAITNGGNIVIEGGADMSAYYTSAQTDAAIAQAVSGLATEQYVQDALSGVNMDNYYTSAQTEEAISAATSGKADAQSVTADYGIPNWNEQGVITSKKSIARTANSNVNGKQYTLISTGSQGFNIFAPTAVGTAGDILVSKGNGAPVWSAVTFPDASNYVTSAQVETQIVEKNYVNSGDVKSQVEAYNYATVSQIPTVPTSNTAFTNDAGYITDAAIENLVTSAQVETQITSKGYATVSQIPTVPTSNTAFTNDAGYITSAAIADKVSSTSVSTIWKGTQADYDDIPTKDPNTFYIIL